MKIKFKLLDGKLPERQTSGSAGYDLYSAVDICVKKNTVELVRLGFSMEMENGVEAQIRSRSGIALKKQVFVLNSPGTIDSDYRGEVAVILYNLGYDDFVVKRGDRIAQMVFARLVDIEMKIDNDLSKTDRLGGFGSTKGI